MKPQQEVTEKTTPTRPLRAMSSVTKQERPVRTNTLQQQPRKSVTWGETNQQPQQPRHNPRNNTGTNVGVKSLTWPHPGRPPVRTPTERTSVWGGVSMAAFRREGTYTKKYDSERDRLQAECNRPQRGEGQASERTARGPHKAGG
ncbi:hypothetical protein Pcinc_021445 [Petrolisthes cinctipes]|uniref:Uncharacterized protein n=1 Tax=Petrolisthes cinctipes TaxID=88211 RepID=A0AAE1FK42_PETCI|nr:hypothetical protein Pcinc_021445 [Petrolisthes cinctipes]